ncbi:hypothetical protein SDC9_169979 [bioreactor metagenome]|uniref:DnaB/C C-terminal domain-containing protein n=2 Tax=root TaxID=1 RepID=A0A645G903_9ZZZZ
MDIIHRACDICFQRINKADFKYIDGILNSWQREGIKTIEDIDKKDNKKTIKKNGSYKVKMDSFNSYDQRNYNFDELEKKLLGWDK